MARQPKARQGRESPEDIKRRAECGAWLRRLREAQGLSSRELALALGSHNLSLVSQIETGQKKLPTHQIRDFARLLGVQPRDFARTLMRYYDPLNYEILFSAKEDQIWQPPEPQYRTSLKPQPLEVPQRSRAAKNTELEDRVRYLESLFLAK